MTDSQGGNTTDITTSNEAAGALASVRSETPDSVSQDGVNP